MNETERYQAYMTALNEATRLYGFQVSAQVQPETLGPVLQVRPIISIVTVQNWQPPAIHIPNQTDEKASLP